jgi:hypothetical protein
MAITLLRRENGKHLLQFRSPCSEQGIAERFCRRTRLTQTYRTTVGEVIFMNNLIRLLVISLVVAAGCGKHDESMAKRVGSSVGEAATDFAAGVGKGVDKQMAVNVELSKSLSDKGLAKTIAKSAAIDLSKPKGGILVYLIASKPFKSKLMAKALNKEGQEIGRSTVDVDFAADDAKYVNFVFGKEMDTQLVDKYVVDVKK